MERRIFIIPVGNKSKENSKQIISKIISDYKEDIDFNFLINGIKSNEDYWIPTRESIPLDEIPFNNSDCVTIQDIRYQPPGDINIWDKIKSFLESDMRLMYFKYFEDLGDKLEDLPIDYLNSLFSFISEYPSDRVGIYTDRMGSVFLWPDEHYGPIFKPNSYSRRRSDGLKHLSISIMVDSSYFTIVSDQIKSIKDVLESEDILLEYEVHPYVKKRTVYKFSIIIYKNNQIDI